MTQARAVYGSAQTVIALSAIVVSGNVTGATVVFDNTTDLAPFGVAVFRCPDTFNGTPTDKSTVDLYMVPVSTGTGGTTNDTTVPNTTSLGAAEYVGSFLIYGTDEAQQKTITISLHGVRKAKYYIYNNTGQNINFSTNAITVRITPFSYQDA